MAAKSTQPSVNTKPAQSHDSLVSTWGKTLWTAIAKESTYALGHDQFFKEFDSLREAAQANKSTKITLLNHVAPIYNHIASQGYQPNIHYKPLKDAVFNFCNKMPVAEWTGPPDQFSRSPSPNLAVLAPTLPNPLPETNSPKLVRTAESNPIPKTKTKPKKGKAKAPISPEVIQSDLDNSEKEAKDPETRHSNSRPLPPTDGMDHHLTPCSLCEQRGHVCHINPKTSSPKAACFECNHWKVKCSLAAPRVKKGEALAEPNDDGDEVPQETAEKPAKKRGHSRRKPTKIPAGQPGQYDGKFLLAFSFVELI